MIPRKTRNGGGGLTSWPKTTRPGNSASEPKQETKGSFVVEALQRLSGGVDRGVIAESFDRIGGGVMIVQEINQNIVRPKRSQCLYRPASNLKEATRLSLE